MGNWMKKDREGEEEVNARDRMWMIQGLKLDRIDLSWLLQLGKLSQLAMITWKWGIAVAGGTSPSLYVSPVEFLGRNIFCLRICWLETGWGEWVAPRSTLGRWGGKRMRGRWLNADLNLKLSTLEFGVFWNCLSLSTRKSSKLSIET